MATKCKGGAKKAPKGGKKPTKGGKFYNRYYMVAEMPPTNLLR